MYRCERCGGTFASFKTPGQCPVCRGWASVRCDGCGYTAHANEFINNDNRCPKCGALVSVGGGSGSDAEGALDPEEASIALLVIFGLMCTVILGGMCAFWCHEFIVREFSLWGKVAMACFGAVALVWMLVSLFRD
jgi:hypothetical protein